MNRRFRSVLACLLAAGVSSGAIAAASEDCRARSDLVGPCFRVHGRAALYNGNPTIRIWKVGTRRLLGVSARCEPPACEPLPAAVRAALDWVHPVYADFVVCPFAPARAGVMRMVCVAAATNLRRGTEQSDGRAPGPDDGRVPGPDDGRVPAPDDRRVSAPSH